MAADIVQAERAGRAALAAADRAFTVQTGAEACKAATAAGRAADLFTRAGLLDAATAWRATAADWRRAVRAYQAGTLAERAEAVPGLPLRVVGA
jgi:hypothetical protein